MYLIIVGYNGEYVTINCDETCTIKTIKEIIRDKLNIDCGNQCLTFGKKVLNNYVQINKYGIVDGCTILLSFQEKGG